MRRGLVVGAVAAAAIGGVAVAAQPVLASGSSSTPSASATPTPPVGPSLVERDTCAHPTGAAPPTDRGPGETFVSFDVPGTVRLRTDAGGVVASSTNTGCHPRAGDTVIVVGDDGVRSATPAEVTVALTDFGTGDWRQPGAWHTR